MKKIFNILSLSFAILVITYFAAPPVYSESGPLKTNLSQAKTNPSPVVYTIDISGNVEPGMAAFVKRALRDIPDGQNLPIIFKMDTFGGRVDSALQIVDTILNTKKGKTIAYVSNKAISAGALIALSCNEIIMKQNTTIGDCAPITYSNDGPKMMGEKFQSPLRAKFRALAKRNGYSETLAESMVTASMEVYQIKIDDKILYLDSQEFADLSKKEKEKIISKKTVVTEDELLTMDDVEAKNFGFSQKSVSSIKEMLADMELGNYEIKAVEQSWSEAFVRFITTITPILMMIGLGALYTEIKAPGFGAPGIIGIICLSLVFFNQYIVGMADYTELLLVVSGIVLLGFELFVIPGFGVAGIGGICCIAAGLILALQDFVIPDPSFPWQAEILAHNIFQVFGSILIAFLISLFMLRYILPRFSAVVKGPYLDSTLESSHANSTEVQSVNIGDTGTAMTFLRPSGKMSLKNTSIDVITEGEYIEKGTSIIISEIKGNRVIVTKGSL